MIAIHGLKQATRWLYVCTRHDMMKQDIVYAHQYKLPSSLFLLISFIRGFLFYFIRTDVLLSFGSIIQYDSLQLYQLTSPAKTCR